MSEPRPNVHQQQPGSPYVTTHSTRRVHFEYTWRMKCKMRLGMAGAAAMAWIMALPTAVLADIAVPADFATITTALEAIADGRSPERTIIVAADSYDEIITVPPDLPAGVVLRGRETARTLLGGTLTINNIADFRVSNFSFIGEGPAIQVIGSTVTIANNVFRLDEDTTAVVSSLSEPVIVNNIFWRGGVAIDAGGNPAVLENNVFVDNSAVLVSEGPGSTITNNAFFGIEALGDAAIVGDPLFVDPDLGDFHLRADSPLIDAGIGDDILDDTISDIGAYGGDHAEGRPFPVQDLDIVSIASDGLENSVTLAWSTNPWYRLGGYRLYYDTDSGPPYTGTGADQGGSPIDIPIGSGNETSTTISGLSAADGSDLTPPVLQAPQPGDRRLGLRWSATPDASGYIVHYRVDGSDDETTIDVGNVTQHTLTGLDNGTDYRIHVTAYIQRNYVFAVTAYPVFDIDNESAFSAQASAGIGSPAGSLPSNEVIDFPEAIVAFPDLPDDNGCFIATAAFGHYGADEVRTLRRFRDEYLMGHAPGRAFVAWYYRHSPQWAASLHELPVLKSVVRLALRPMIGIAAVLVRTPSET